jgi:hypothetical protein
MFCCYFFYMLNKATGTGHPNVSIVGGIPARAGEFPYLVRYTYFNNIDSQEQ